MGWKAPKYAHTAQLMKIDPETGGKRKLSKRKDPELALTFYAQEGYPVPAVLEYLMTLLNSNFEEWRRANPDLPMNDFQFTTKKMSGSGALFDIEKLRDVSKNVISRMTAEQVYNYVAEWSAVNDKEFNALLTRDPAFSKAYLAMRSVSCPSAAAAKSRARILRCGRMPRATWTSCSTSCSSRITPCRSASPLRTPRQS